MSRITLWFTTTVFALGLLGALAYSEEHMGGAGIGKPSSLRHLMGASVTTPRGEELGRITDFAIDAHGRVAFVIVARGGFFRVGGKEVAIPYSSFAYDRMERHFVLDVTKEKLNAAPPFAMRDLLDERWAEKVYRYFGKAPYWTEGKLVEEEFRNQEPLENSGDSGYDDSY